jgi:hypothetical protein
MNSSTDRSLREEGAEIKDLGAGGLEEIDIGVRVAHFRRTAFIVNVVNVELTTLHVSRCTVLGGLYLPGSKWEPRRLANYPEFGGNRK